MLGPASCKWPLILSDQVPVIIMSQTRWVEAAACLSPRANKQISLEYDSDSLTHACAHTEPNEMGR